MTDYTYTPPLAPPEFEHAMRQAAYQLKRANGLDAPAPVINVQGECPIEPRDDCSVAPVPKHGFNGS